MYLLFVDESGTPAKPSKSNPRFFVIGSVIIPEERWHTVREKLIGLKRSKHYRGELKWRFFAPRNNDDDNPMRSWEQDARDDLRREVFSIIAQQRSIKIIGGVASAEAAYELNNVHEPEDIYFRTYKIITERFQYFLQDISRETGREANGIIISDHRNRGQDTRLRDQHERLVRHES